MEAPKYDRVLVGKLLKSARIASGLTQEKAAEAAGCSLRHLVQVEGGTTGMSIDLLLSLCSVYHITPDNAFSAVIPDRETDTDEVALLSAYRRLSKEQKKTARALVITLAKDLED